MAFGGREARRVVLLQRLNGWRLWLLFLLLTVVAALAIVSLMGLALKGQVDLNDLLTGLVATGLVAPLSLWLAGVLLREVDWPQQALAEQQEPYRAIFSQAGEAIDLVDAQTLQLVEANQAACRMLGYQHEELVGQALGAILVSADEAVLRGSVDALLRDGESCFEAQHRSKGGGLIDVVLSTRAIRLRGRDCLVRVWRDIGENKAAAEALKESHNLLQAIIDAAPVRVFWKDRELRYLGCNPAFAHDAGLASPDDLLGKDDRQLAWSAQAEHYRADDRAVMASGVPRLSFEEPQTTPDGRTIWLRTSKVPLRNAHHQTIGILGVYEDVTDHRRAEQALREREEIYRAIVNRSVEGILLIDAQTLEFTEFNDAACEGLGYAREEFARLRLPDIQGVMDPAQTLEKFSASARSPEGLSFENRHRCKDGSLRDRHVSNRAVEVHGRTYVAHVWHDVTQAKQLADALRQREQYQRALLDNFPFMVWLKDEQSRFLAVNEAFAKTFGWPDAQSLVGKSDLDIAPPDLAEHYRADDRAVLQSGRSKQVEEQIERDGRRIWFETYKSPVSIGGTVIGTVGFGRDITERKAAERNLKMAVEVTQVVFWTVDLMTQGLHYEQNDLPALGLEAEDPPMTLQAWLDRVHPQDRPRFAEQLDDARQPAGPVFDLEYRMQRRDGSYQWMHTKGSVVQRNAAGWPEIAVGTSMNITARKQAQLELERHRQHLEVLVEQRTTELLATEARASRILESAADGMYGVDPQGRITFINAAACRMLGYNVQQALGRGAHELFHAHRADGQPLPASECLTCQAWQTGEWRASDETYWHADGRPVPVALASHPLEEQGRFVGAVVSVVDMSLQRAAAQAREQALLAAENLARVRSEFLANMSHEIRTPMNGVLGFARIGQRNYWDPQKACQAFEKILVSGQQLLGVVNEILDFSKIDAGELQLEASELSIHAVLDDAIQLVAERARAKGLELQLHKAANLPPQCIGDPLRLGQVLLNLLTNAVKFTEAGGVTLDATREGEQLVFRVSDTGIGMSSEEQAYVFNPFRQADGSTTRRFGGTGLGLAISKRLLELMHGEIGVQSTPGAGSVFEVRVPFVPPAPSPPVPNPDASVVAPPDKPLDGVRILLAEDDEINRTMLGINLTEDGAMLVMVDDGAKAVERVQGDGPQAYDLVLLDIQMPVMDGYEAARRIRQLAPGLPIVGQTAHAFNEDRDKCLAVGMVGHIAKPIDPPALVRLLLQVLAERRRAV